MEAGKKKAAKDTPTIVAGILAIAAYFAGLNEILMLLLAGIGVMLIKNRQQLGPGSGNSRANMMLLPFSGLLAQAGSTTTAAISVGWASVFFVLLKSGLRIVRQWICAAGFFCSETS